MFTDARLFYLDVAQLGERLLPSLDAQILEAYGARKSALQVRRAKLVSNIEKLKKAGGLNA